MLQLELEYIGPDLAQFADDQKWSQLSARAQHRIWTDLAKGMEYIHSQHVVHCDIKPQNVLFDTIDRGAVICDFGLSVKEAGQPLRFNGGTPCYVPPEYLSDDHRGFEGDIWAFGITMLFVFRLITLPCHDWRIADTPHDMKVRQHMLDWLYQIERIRKTVPRALFPLPEMLAADPRKRITAAALTKYPLNQPFSDMLPA